MKAQQKYMKRLQRAGYTGAITRREEHINKTPHDWRVFINRLIDIKKVNDNETAS